MSAICDDCQCRSNYTVMLAGQLVCDECVADASQKLAYTKWLAEVYANLKEDNVSPQEAESPFLKWFQNGISSYDASKWATEVLAQNKRG